MKKAVAVLLLALMAICCVLPVTTQAVTVKREYAVIVNVDSWCNMRAKPTVESEIVARVNRGDSVILLCWNEDETWCYVDYNGKLGWINVKFLKSEGVKEVETIGAALPKPEPIEKPDDKGTEKPPVTNTPEYPMYTPVTSHDPHPSNNPAPTTSAGTGETGGDGEDGGDIDLGGGDGDDGNGEWTPPKL